MARRRKEMSNYLFNQLNRQTPNNMSNFVNQFNQFRNSFKGDPRQQVQELLNSGRMTQAQFNQLKQIADQFKNFIR